MRCPNEGDDCRIRSRMERQGRNLYSGPGCGLLGATRLGGGTCSANRHPDEYSTLTAQTRGYLNVVKQSRINWGTRIIYQTIMWWLLQEPTKGTWTASWHFLEMEISVPSFNLTISTTSWQPSFQLEDDPNKKRSVGFTVDRSVNLCNSLHFNARNASQGNSVWMEDNPGCGTIWLFILPNVHGAWHTGTPTGGTWRAIEGGNFQRPS